MRRLGHVTAPLLLAASAAAQCTPGWEPDFGTGMAGMIDNYVDSLAVHPSGDIIAGGRFLNAGGTSANRIARWNGSSWSPLGKGIPSIANVESVLALTVQSNGHVIAGGNFTQPALRVARWDGAAWVGLGSGFDNNSVHTLGILSNSDLVAGGSFTTSGTTEVRGLARWNGSAWVSIGGGITGFIGASREVRAILELPGGDLLIGGAFTTAGTTPASCIARWDGQQWTTLGAGLNNIVMDLARLPNGDIIAAGNFTQAGGAPASRVARWDGESWTPLGSGTSGIVTSLHVDPDGTLVAAGTFFTAGGVTVRSIARWDGAAWSPMTAGPNLTVAPGDVHVRALVPHQNDLIIGGHFNIAGIYTSANIARFGCQPCYANCDNSSGSPLLTGNDFLCFVNMYIQPNVYANCDGSTSGNTLTPNDFLCFINRYAAGCS